MDQDSDSDRPKLASTLEECSSSKMTLATGDFLLRVSSLYSIKAPFLSADCASKALTLNSQTSTKNDLIPLAKRFEKLKRSTCSRCKSSLIVGQNATLTWKSTGGLLRRFGGERKIQKLESKMENGTRLKKAQNRVYARYLKMKAANGGIGPRLIVTCSNCRGMTAVPINQSANRLRQSFWKDRSRGNVDKSRDQLSMTGDSVISEGKKKRKRRRKEATLNLTPQPIEKSELVTPSASFKKVHKKTLMPTPVSTPRTQGTPGTVSSGGQNKKKMKSRLDKLLAAEEEKKNRGSFGSAGGLASFLESL